MNKTIQIIVLFIVLSSFSQNQASAGFFDWLVSKEQSSILVEAPEDNSLFYHQDIWELINEKNARIEEPKIEYEVVRESVRQVTAYNVGDVYQTDSTPCIGAYSKVDLCEEIEKGVNVCAANFVPLNTILRIETANDESFECIVWDRMNSRYTSRVDIAMGYDQKAQARQFGLKRLTVQILREVPNNETSI